MRLQKGGEEGNQNGLTEEMPWPSPLIDGKNELVPG